MVTAAEALRRTDLRQRAAGAARCQDRAVVAVLRGWTRGHASKRAAILAALEVEGVDVATIPQLTGEDQEEMRQRARPCPACAAKDAEWSRRWKRLRDAAAELVIMRDDNMLALQCCVDSENALQAELADLRASVAVWSSCAQCGSRRPVDPTSPLNLYCARCREAGHARIDAEKASAQAAVVRLQRELADARDEAAAIRARVAELEAASLRVPQTPTTGVAKVFGALPDMPLPSDPPPPPRPDATTEAIARAVGRPCTVRLDLGDGVLVRAAEAAG